MTKGNLFFPNNFIMKCHVIVNFRSVKKEQGRTSKMTLVGTLKNRSKKWKYPPMFQIGITRNFCIVKWCSFFSFPRNNDSRRDKNFQRSLSIHSLPVPSPTGTRTGFGRFLSQVEKRFSKSINSFFYENRVSHAWHSSHTSYPIVWVQFKNRIVKSCRFSDYNSHLLICV